MEWGEGRIEQVNDTTVYTVNATDTLLAKRMQSEATVTHTHTIIWQCGGFSFAFFAFVFPFYFYFRFCFVLFLIRQTAQAVKLNRSFVLGVRWLCMCNTQKLDEKDIPPLCLLVVLFKCASLYLYPVNCLAMYWKTTSQC